MEAATTPPRQLAGEKAQRIVEAMRRSVAVRGVAGSTFDHVAREAGVSRGLLHYYFGTKERLLVEVVRRDCDVQLARLDDQLAGARDADDVLGRLVASLGDLVEREPETLALVFDLFTLARRNDEVAAEFRELIRRTRDHVAGLLERLEAEGVVRLAAPADAIADLIFALADGLGMRMIADPGHDWSATVGASVASLGRLLRT